MEKNGKKLMMFIVATNVVANRPTEHRPTGMPNTRANSWKVIGMFNKRCLEMSGRCLKSTRKWSLSCLECVWRVFGTCLEGVRKVY